ncbi:hypothetical protein PybrP1_012756 [[Pythium] brassicae (nom. inval.)]|nr:hypothetical protein PybrP1_012756 [[Pythium] brassicae (nom. inval.)]
MTDDVQVAAGAAVCAEATLQGVVRIGQRCVVHPAGEIRARAAPVTLGDRNVLEDRAVLESAAGEPMTVGSDNLFESGCVVRARVVGSGNWFEPKAQALEGSEIGDNCLIGSGVVVAAGERVPDNSVLVCVQDARGRLTRIVRPQKDFLLRAREALVHKYLDAFLDGSKSAVALEKHHRLLPVVSASRSDHP